MKNPLKNAVKQQNNPINTGGESVSYTSNIQPYAAKSLQALYADLLSHGSNLPEGMSLTEFQELEKTNPEKAKQLQAEVAKSKIYGKPRIATYTPLQEKIFGKINKETGEYNPSGSMLEAELGNQAYGNQFNRGTEKIEGLLNKEVSPNIQGYLSNATKNPLGAETEEQYIANRHPGIMKMYEEQAQRNLEQNILPALGDQFISARMYGGGRHGEMKERIAKGAQEMLQERREAIANQLAQQFHGAQANYGQRNLGAANIAENAGSQDINRQATLAGRLQESALANRQSNQQALQFGAGMAQAPQYQQQQALNTAYQDWEKQQNAPLEHIGRASNFLNQTPMNSQTTTVSPPQIIPQASPWTQAGGMVGAMGTSLMNRPQGQGGYGAAHGGHITHALTHRSHYALGGQVSPQGQGAVQQTFYVGEPNNNMNNQGNMPRMPQGINGGMQNTMMNAQPQSSFSSMQNMLTQAPGGMPNNPNWYQEFSNQQYNGQQQQQQMPANGMAQPNMGEPRPQMMAHGGHVHHIRHYAEGGRIPNSPIHRGVNDALDSAELQQIREQAMRMQQPQGDPLWGALTKGFLNIAMNRKPGVLAAIGEGGNAAFDEYNAQHKVNHERGLESAKLLKMIDDTRRWQADQNRNFGLKEQEHALDREYKMGTLGESKRHNAAMESEKSLKLFPLEERRAQVISKKEEKELNSISEIGSAAEKALGTIQQMAGMVNDIGATGPVTGGVLPDVVSTMGGLYGSISKREDFKSLSSELVNAVTSSLAGVQSDKDMDLWKQSVASIDKTPEGNALILERAEKMSRRAMEAEEYINKRYAEGSSVAEAKKEWRKFANENPLCEEQKSQSNIKNNDLKSLSDADLDRQIKALGG